MRKLLLAVLLVVLTLPSVASAVQPSGTPVVVPDGRAEGTQGAAPSSWLFNNIFFVRAHICRPLGVILCGPDPLVSSGNPFSGVTRIWVPFNDLYTVYLFVSDPEGNVVAFSAGNFNFPGNSYQNIITPFNPIGDGLYKFHGLVTASSGLITFSDFYQFRVGGPGSGGCCP